MKSLRCKIGLPLVGPLGFIFLFSFLITSIYGGQEIRLFELVKKINLEQVETIILRGNNIEAVLKDGTHLYLTKEKKVSLSESLVKAGANPEKLRKVKVEVGEPPSDTFQTVRLFLPLILLPSIVYGVWFLVLYFLVLAGFRILRIEGVAQSKIVIYIFVIFILTQLANPAINRILGGTANTNFLTLINALTYFVAVGILLRYYFSLTSKKFWQLLLYLGVVTLLSNLTIPLLSSLIGTLQHTLFNSSLR
jgi:hypothetical protein